MKKEKRGRVGSLKKLKVSSCTIILITSKQFFQNKTLSFIAIFDGILHFLNGALKQLVDWSLPTQDIPNWNQSSINILDIFYANSTFYLKDKSEETVVGNGIFKMLN